MSDVNTEALNTASPEKKSSARKFIVPVVVAIALIGGVGYVASKAGLDKALVKQAMDNLAANIHTNAAKKGGDVTLTYKDIEIAGGFTNRHAIILAPKLVTKAPTGELTSYTTESVAVFPTAADLSAVRIEAAKPIILRDIADDNAAPTLTITQKAAIVATVTPEKRGETNFINTSITLPDAFLIDGPKDKASDPWNVVTITLAPNGTLAFSNAEGDDNALELGSSNIALKDIAITPDATPDDALRIASIRSTYNHELNDKKISNIVFKTVIENIESSQKILPYGPVRFELDGTFEGALPKTPEAFAEVKNQKSALKLKTLALKAKDAAVFATADFVAGASDVLPVGTANITIENLAFIIAELKRNEIVDAKSEQTLAAFVQQISGKSLADNKNLSIDITRVREGAFQIGKTTFEELMAIMLKGVLSGKYEATSPADEKAMPAPSEKEAVKEQAPVADEAPNADAPSTQAE